jgi:hypothetical protein
MEPCKCCPRKKPKITIGEAGYGFNRLDGNDREWAQNNRFSKSEYCVPVKDGKKFGGPVWQKVKCGDGTMGFSTRRKNQEEVHLEQGLDGQWKKKRHTLVRPKSARASAGRRPRRVDGSKYGVASSVEIAMASRDPVVVAERRRVDKKFKRARNRNNGARRGHMRSRKVAA